MQKQFFELISSKLRLQSKNPPDKSCEIWFCNFCHGDFSKYWFMSEINRLFWFLNIFGMFCQTNLALDRISVKHQKCSVKHKNNLFEFCQTSRILNKPAGPTADLSVTVIKDTCHRSKLVPAGSLIKICSPAGHISEGPDRTGTSGRKFRPDDAGTSGPSHQE